MDLRGWISELLDKRLSEDTEGIMRVFWFGALERKLVKGVRGVRRKNVWHVTSWTMYCATMIHVTGCCGGSKQSFAVVPNAC